MANEYNVGLKEFCNSIKVADEIKHCMVCALDEEDGYVLADILIEVSNSPKLHSLQVKEITLQSNLVVQILLVLKFFHAAQNR